MWAWGGGKLVPESGPDASLDAEYYDGHPDLGMTSGVPIGTYDPLGASPGPNAMRKLKRAIDLTSKLKESVGEPPIDASDFAGMPFCSQVKKLEMELAKMEKLKCSPRDERAPKKGKGGVKKETPKKGEKMADEKAYKQVAAEVIIDEARKLVERNPDLADRQKELLIYKQLQRLYRKDLDNEEVLDEISQIDESVHDLVTNPEVTAQEIIDEANKVARSVASNSDWTDFEKKLYVYMDLRKSFQPSDIDNEEVLDAIKQEDKNLYDLVTFNFFEPSSPPAADGPPPPPAPPPPPPPPAAGAPPPPPPPPPPPTGGSAAGAPPPSTPAAGGSGAPSGSDPAPGFMSDIKSGDFKLKKTSQAERERQDREKEAHREAQQDPQEQLMVAIRDGDTSKFIDVEAQVKENREQKLEQLKAKDYVINPNDPVVKQMLDVQKNRRAALSYSDDDSSDSSDSSDWDDDDSSGDDSQDKGGGSNSWVSYVANALLGF